MVRSIDQHIHYKYGAKRKAERRYVLDRYTTYMYAVIRRTKNFLTKHKPRRTLRTIRSIYFLRPLSLSSTSFKPLLPQSFQPTPLTVA